jgi:hypothetical protein
MKCGMPAQNEEHTSIKSSTGVEDNFKMFEAIRRDGLNCEW